MPGSRRLPSGIVTFCLTDIEGSTALMRALGSEYQGLLVRCRELLAGAFTCGGGTVVSTTGGDGMFAVFDDAAAAARSCLAAQVAVAHEPWPGGVAVRVRAGLHTGHAEPVQDDYVALAVNQTARVAAAAHGGQVLLSDATASTARSGLQEDLSVEPLGRYRLRDFEAPEQLWQLRHPALDPRLPPPMALPALESNLPRGRGSFIGRERELDKLASVLVPGAVVSVVGPGGVGKTRLAVEVARRVADRFRDLRRFVDLSVVAEDRAVEPMVVEELAGGAMEEGGDLLFETAVRNARGASLLLLDNCEHVLAGAARTVERLLEQCPDLTVLATSRSRLDLAEERVFRLSPLQVPPAQTGSVQDVRGIESVRLFLDRAERARVGFNPVEADVIASAAIVRRIDGIPLAIELAAALAAHHDPTAIDAQLRRDPVLTALSLVQENATTRQRTLEAVVAWSYRLLDPPVRRVFRAIAVFAGAFGDDAAAVVASGDAESGLDVTRALRILVERSLLVADTGPDKRARYRLLETVRLVAGEWLAAHVEEHKAASASHAAWALEIARSANQRFDDPASGTEGFDDLLEAHHEELRFALNRRGGGPTAERLELALAVARHDEDRGRYDDGWELLLEALEVAGGEAPLYLRAQALRTLGVLAWRRRKYREATMRSEAALEMARALGDSQLEARCFNNLGAISVSQDDYAVARRYFEQALALAAAAKDEVIEAFSQNHLGTLARLQGEWDEAARRLERALVLATRIGTPQFACSILPRLGGLAWARGDYEGAAEYDLKGLELARDLSRPLSELHCLYNLGYVALAQGRFEEARAWFNDAGERNEMLGWLPDGESDLCLAKVARGEGRLAEAAAILGRLVRLVRGGSGHRVGLLEVIEEAALVAGAGGDVIRAAELADAAATLRSASGRALEIPYAVELEALRAALPASRLRGVPLRVDDVLPIAQEVTRDLANLQ